MALAVDRNRPLLWLAALALAHSTAWGAQAPDVTPAYVSRGRQTDDRQHAYHDRIERFYQAVSDTLRAAAPDLLGTLAAPPPVVHGYQILPKLVADPAPPPPGTKAEVVSYSWGRSDTRIELEMARLERLEAALAQVPADAGRARYEQLADDYRGVIARRKPIDADIQYNWLWQARIDANRPLFDRLKTVQDAVLEQRAIEAALASRDEATLKTAAATHWVAPPDFVRFEDPSAGLRLVTVPLYTDITDAVFVEAFRSAVETLWRARVGDDEFRVRVAIETIPPEQLYCGHAAAVTASVKPCAPPARGDAVDLEAHVARFPKGGAVLTTGAPTLQWVGTSAIVLGPDELTAHVLAHEFGHVLGFPDAYTRGYRDLGPEGYQITELVDFDDIMGAPGVGPILARHFEELFAANFLNTSFRHYEAGDFQGSVDAARMALRLRPDYAEAYNNIAAGLASLKRWDEAIQAAREALRVNPDFPLARNNLAWAEAEKQKSQSRGDF
jgi:tetratricopeptide (TPR) repeat protein